MKFGKRNGKGEEKKGGTVYSSVGKDLQKRRKDERLIKKASAGLVFKGQQNLESRED